MKILAKKNRAWGRGQQPRGSARLRLAQKALDSGRNAKLSKNRGSHGHPKLRPARRICACKNEAMRTSLRYVKKEIRLLGLDACNPRLTIGAVEIGRAHV